jgi:hypothetical protein
MIKTQTWMSLVVTLAGCGALLGCDGASAEPERAKTTAVAAHLDDATATACASLTGAAIQAVIKSIADSSAKAESDAAAHGVDGGPGYPSAARDNLSYLISAHDQMVALLDWLHEAEVLDPPAFVSNVSAAYNIHGYVREAVVALHYARHWATISASYHGSLDARDSFELTTQALELIEPLGAQAGRCYMDAYGPYN